MKRLFRTSFSLCLLAACLSQAFADDYRTTVAEPRDSWWMDRHQAKLQEIAENADAIDLVFIGDSITHFMDDRAPGLVERTFPGAKHLNLGYSADRTENVLWRLRNGEIDGIAPEFVMLMIGTNNTGHRQDPAAETVAGIRLILEEIRKQLPDSKVLLLSIFPRGETPADPLRQLNEKINAQLPRLADGRTVFHLDINDAFLDEDGRLSKEVMPDLLHPNRKGYEIWLAGIQPKVQEILAMEKLPTPPEIWDAYDPDAGDYKEEIIREETRDGIYYRDTYISAYALGEEIRVYCKYAVKEGAVNAPGLMNVHGWMGAPTADNQYVNDGWAVMAHDYCGKASGRQHFTKYPESLRRGNMDRAEGPPIWSHKNNRRDNIEDYRETSDYLWYAIQRRVLSYLLAQKEVDKNRIGAKGYSYGGTIMWNLGMDPRVKAVVAYFGIGWNEYYRSKGVWMYNNPYREPKKTAGEELYLSSVAPQAHAPHMTAATLWLNGSNDHHGGHERGGETFKMFKRNVPWDFAVQARGHHNTEKLGSGCKLWLENHVLGAKHFWPARPVSKTVLGQDGVPEHQVTPANPEKIEELRIHYALKSPNNVARAWRDTESVRNGNTWTAEMPVLDVDDYVFAYATIRYENDCVVSSDFVATIPSELGKAIATDKPSTQLSESTGAWTDVAPVEGIGGVEGFRVLKQRGTMNEQFNDPKWKAPEGAKLGFKFYCTQPQTLLLGVNRHYERKIEITASDDTWQTMVVPATTLLNKYNQQPMASWGDTNNLTLKSAPGSDITKVIFTDFKWIVPAQKASHEKASATKLPEAGKDGKAYLTKEAASVCKSFLPVMNDKGVVGKPLSVGGKIYKRGLGVHADSEISFALKGKFSAFHVTPGPDDAHNGLIEMKILVDGNEMYASGKVRKSGFTPKPVKIPLQGAKKLTLIVTDAGDGKGGDHASWADAYLVP